MKTKILSSLFVLLALISVGILYAADSEADAIPGSKVSKSETQPLSKVCEAFTTDAEKTFILRNSFAICQKPYAYNNAVTEDVFDLLYGEDSYFGDFFGDLSKANIKVIKSDYHHDGTGYLGRVKFYFTLEKNGVEKNIHYYMNTVLCENRWFLHFDMDNPIASIKRKFDNIKYLMVTAFNKKKDISKEMMEFMLMLDGTKESAVKAIEKYRDNAKIDIDGLNELPLAEARVIESKDGVYVVDFTIAFDTLVRYEIRWENGKIISAKKIER